MDFMPFFLVALSSYKCIVHLAGHRMRFETTRALYLLQVDLPVTPSNLTTDVFALEAGMIYVCATSHGWSYCLQTFPLFFPSFFSGILIHLFLLILHCICFIIHLIPSRAGL